MDFQRFDKVTGPWHALCCFATCVETRSPPISAAPRGNPRDIQLLPHMRSLAKFSRREIACSARRVRDVEVPRAAFACHEPEYKKGSQFRPVGNLFEPLRRMRFNQYGMKKTTADQDPSLPSVVFDMPSREHGAAIHRLVSDCKPLDLNSRYAYLLLCEHFADTCVRAAQGGETIGFISAYRPPRRPDVLFVWQVATAPSARGRGLARSMLHALVKREAVRACRFVETTVSPSNAASRRLFQAFARDLNAQLAESVLFAEGDFGDEVHEQEILFRIGPIEGRQPTRRIGA